MAEKLTKTDLDFLRKVEAKQVYKAVGYTKRKGGYTRFEGGEERAMRYANRGLIRMPGFADMGRPSFAELTDAGRAALEPRDDR